MGLLWVAAAAAAYKKSQHGHRRHKSHNQSNSHSYDDISSKVSTHSYYDCVLAEIKSDPNGDLAKLFEMLKSEYCAKLAEIDAEITNGVNQKKKEFNESIKTYSSIKDLFDSVSIYEAFDRILKKATSRESFYEILDKLISEKYDNIGFYSKKLLQLNSETDEYKKRQFFSITRKDFWALKIKQCEDSHDYAKRRLEQECDEVHTLELVKRICKNNSETINKAIEEEISSRPLQKEIEALLEKDKDLHYCERGYSFDSSIIEQVFEDCIKTGKITETDLQKIYLLLDKVEIKGRRGEYKFGYVDYSSVLYRIVEWFIANVYELDESFVERNYELPDEDFPRKRTNQ